MKKNKTKKASKQKPTLLSGAVKSLSKLRKKSVGKLSTTQKVLVGAALAGLGARYLSKRIATKKAGAPVDKPLNDDAALAEFNLTTLEEEAA